MAGDRFYGFDLHERKTLENLGVTEGLATSLEVVADLQLQVANLNAWATALVTKLNADFTAQNAAVTSSQLDTDYDTDPQA